MAGLRGEFRSPIPEADKTGPLKRGHLDPMAKITFLRMEEAVQHKPAARLPDSQAGDQKEGRSGCVATNNPLCFHSPRLEILTPTSLPARDNRPPL